MYKKDDILLSVVADFNAKIINNSFNKLVANDNTLVPEHNYVPTIWEQKWFNNKSIRGYDIGQCVWRNTMSSLDDFLSSYGDLVYDYASKNDKLGKTNYLSNSWSKLIESFGDNERILSVQRLKYYNIISGYSDISVNSTTGQQVILKHLYDPLFDYGNATADQTDNSRLEIYVSTRNDNKELLSNRIAWKNIILSDQASYDNYISTEISILFKQHISAYHFNDELTPQTIRNVLMSVDFSNFRQDDVQKSLVHDHQSYINSEGFDYVVKFAKREDDFKVLEQDGEHIYKLYKWFRLWSSGHLEHGGIIPCNELTLVKDKLKPENYILSADLGWETSSTTGELQLAEVYDYTPLSNSFYGNITGKLYYAKKSPDSEISEIYAESGGNLGQESRYVVDITPVSFNVFKDLSAGKVKDVESLSSNGSGYSTPLHNVVSSYISIEVHHMKNNSFSFTKNNTDDIGNNNRIQFYQYYVSGYKTSRYSSMSIERSDIMGIKEKYKYTGTSISSIIDSNVKVTTCTGKVLKKGMQYELKFTNDISSGVGSVTVRAVHPFEGERILEFVVE